MPIQNDPNIPVIPGYVMSVSFHLLRNGEPIDIENATYVVTELPKLDAHLAVRPNPNADPVTATLQTEAVVLIRSKLVSNNFQRRDEYVVTPTSEGIDQTVTKDPPTGNTWIKFAYTQTFDPSSTEPCPNQFRSNKQANITQADAVSLGQPVRAKVAVTNTDQNTNLLSSTDPLTIGGYTKKITQGSTCILGNEVSREWDIQPISFDPTNYPKSTPSAPDAKVKLLWLAAYSDPTT